MANAGQIPRRFAFCPVLACFLGALLFAGCGKQPPAPESQSTATTNSTPLPKVAGPGPNEKVCFECKGQGTVPCRVPGCTNGEVDCPGPCLKLSKGVWVHMNVAGHDPKELWQIFPNRNGQGGYQAWNQDHVGEVIVYKNGVAVNIGKCKVCGGTGKVKCDVCKGTGRQICPVCNGTKFVPLAWTPTNNPWFNSQPDLIRLKDGRVVLGRVAVAIGEERTIITRDKQTLHVKASDILPQADTNPPAAKTSSSK
ncbi:MAG: hypothetical protein ACLP2Y_16015 [Limisphaerales bacterium]